MAPPDLCSQCGDIAEGFVEMGFSSFYGKEKEKLSDVGCPPSCKVLFIKADALARNKCSTLSQNLRALCKKYVGKLFFCDEMITSTCSA